MRTGTTSTPSPRWWTSANRLNVSDDVRGALRAHPPIRAAIEANPSAPVVRAFLTRA